MDKTDPMCRDSISLGFPIESQKHKELCITGHTLISSKVVNWSYSQLPALLPCSSVPFKLSTRFLPLDLTVVLTVLIALLSASSSASACTAAISSKVGAKTSGVKTNALFNSPDSWAFYFPSHFAPHSNRTCLAWLNKAYTPFHTSTSDTHAHRDYTTTNGCRQGKHRRCPLTITIISDLLQPIDNLKYWSIRRLVVS